MCIVTQSVFASPLSTARKSLHNAQFCYVPTKNNVSYSDVLSLHTEEPAHHQAYSDNPHQYGEIWLPSASFSAKKPPLIVLIHGGCWLSAYDIKHTHALSTALRHSGYAVWSIEYRRSGNKGGGWPGTFNDIELALEWVLNQPDTPYDNRKLAIIGHSAGGHLALLAGSTFRKNTSIKAVIGLAAITDLAAYARGSNSCETATTTFMGGSPEQRPNEYRLANPVTLPMHFNSILIHGSLDTIVNPAQAEKIADARTILVEGAGHFDMVHPGTQSFQELLKQLGQHL